MSWTDERVELLKKLWTDGLSASQIAAELGGITRNAVIGKVHRLGFSGRAKPSSSTPRARKPRSHMLRVARPAMRGNTALAGNRVPQVPSYNVGIGVRYVNHGWSASSQIRVTGPQFEDDINLFTLRRATVVDVFGSRMIELGLNLIKHISLFRLRHQLLSVCLLTCYRLQTKLPGTHRVGTFNQNAEACITMLCNSLCKRMNSAKVWVALCG